MTIEPVDWELAGRVAGRVAGRHGTLDVVQRGRLSAHFAELTATAEDIVVAETGLRSLRGPARAVVVDRVEWAHANVASFQRLLLPVTTKLGEQLARTRGPKTLARKLAGSELGMLLGWMSARVLGQYDLLVVDDVAAEEQDLVYYVGTNVLGLEQRFGFPPDQFRLWLAVHEVTHRAQFTGIDWMRPYFLNLVEQALGSFDPDPKRFLDALRKARSPEGSKVLADGGLMGLLATDVQREYLARIGGLMSLLEGHGDVVMNRAAPDLIPSAPRFARVLAHRRQSQPAATRAIQRLLGLEAKLAQYEQGERFIAAIETELGDRALERCWAGPEQIPTLEEIREPRRWLDRLGLAVG